jgi:transposase
MEVRLDVNPDLCCQVIVAREEIKVDKEKVELCTSYLSEYNLHLPYERRQKLLLQSWYFVCECPRCVIKV